jgi:transcriptional regulator with XRE-family HTH domain
MNFGTRLRNWRVEADISQRELARRADLNFSYLSKIEAGLVPPPSDDKIRALAVALERSASEADDLLRLAQDSRIPSDIIKAALIQNPEVGALLRRIQHRRLTEQELKELMQVVDAGTTRQESDQG